MIYWKNLKLGTKFIITFGALTILLVISALWAVHGISGILNNAKEVIDGNKLRATLEEKFVQHLHWVHNSILITEVEN